MTKNDVAYFQILYVLLAAAADVNRKYVPGINIEVCIRSISLGTCEAHISSSGTLVKVDNNTANPDQNERTPTAKKSPTICTTQKPWKNAHVAPTDQLVLTRQTQSRQKNRTARPLHPQIH